ncbi:transcriptional regulator LacI family [Butyrivibrio proteoclasticus B316]|uniref:Transcriptional regulator LacI family n=1 Tax=Butyrivibrio proteoclasticus (strain ATCC 51982 / DSM 14932 / B316) TaxID=515622 RepID=E0RYP6_BUTPB|nr:LacI family DNA-binding transcriptional regulator [Butyrivibrio proteoclasticus]ADL34741.1 transcriptional regulator LacI family [Butyrivibrio proteoclasticus B316]
MTDDKITIDDVAKALGISKTTVSRAISGKGRVGNSTRAKVMEFIEKHNYRPNVMARALAQQRTFNIGVVWPCDYNAVDLPFFQRCMIGMSEITSSFGYDIVVSLIAGDDLSSLKRIIENHKVDGVVLTRTMVNDTPAMYLKESGVPFVAIGKTDDPDIITVDNDNLGACKELTSILLAKGLRKLALIGGSTNHIITRTRYEGFVDAFESMGLEVDQNLVYLDIENNIKIGGIIKTLLKKNIDGVICMDDSIAGEVISRCRDEHIRIPDDLRVASFYNSSLLESTVPSVTSLNFNDRNLGAEAARTLLAIIAGENAQSKMLKNYEVILKESTK